MSVIRVGSNTKYAEGWASVFGKGGAKGKPKKAVAKKKKAASTKRTKAGGRKK